MSNIPQINLSDLTNATTAGSGAFDVLMRASRAHLDEEFSRNRIKGGEYAQVYLGSLTQILQTATQFLLEKDQAALQAQLIQAQVKLAEQQAANSVIEGQNLVLQSEILRQQALNLAAERENMLSQKALQAQQILNLKEDLLQTKAQTALITQNTKNAASQDLQIKAQNALISQQTTNAITENATMLLQQDKLKEDTQLVTQQVINAEVEGRVMESTVCKLKAEFDLLQETKLKTVAETGLLNQKKATEKAQTVADGVDADSVVGKQKALYGAQTDGFKRDAEQKAAKLMVDSWSVRRTTDEGTVADSTNMLNDATVGRTVARLLAGVNA